jgi:hypothetical protein
MPPAAVDCKSFSSPMANPQLQQNAAVEANIGMKNTKGANRREYGSKSAISPPMTPKAKRLKRNPIIGNIIGDPFYLTKLGLVSD